MIGLLIVASPPDPSLVDACGEDPGTACQFVYDHTSTEWLAKLVDFIVARPLKILLIVVVAWLLAKLTRRLIRRFASELVGSVESGRLRKARSHAPSVLLSQQQPSLRSAARTETISQVLQNLATAVIWTFAGVYVLAALGLSLGPLIAGAGIVGVALGFGAQSLVKDFLSGMFMLIEDQYGVGDVIDVGEATGTVEAVSCARPGCATSTARCGTSRTARSSGSGTSRSSGPVRSSTSWWPTTPTWTGPTRS